MPSDLQLMVLQIPNEISLDYIKELKKEVYDIDCETAKILNNFIDYDIDDIDISDELDEEDLYNITSEDIKIKHAARDHLVNAINLVLSPRIGISNRFNSPVIQNGIKYIVVKDCTYAIAGYEASYMSKVPSKSYSFLTALSISSIIKL